MSSVPALTVHQSDLLTGELDVCSAGEDDTDRPRDHRSGACGHQ